jgi:FCD domain
MKSKIARACCGRQYDFAHVAGVGKTLPATATCESSAQVGWWCAFATDGHRELAAEHRQLMDLTLARDASAAVEALAVHIKRRQISCSPTRMSTILMTSMAHLAQ